MNPKNPNLEKKEDAKAEFVIKESEPECAEDANQDLLRLLQEYLEQDDTEITD